MRSPWRRRAGDANSTLLVFHDVARALEVEGWQVVTPMKPAKNPAPRRPGRPKATPGRAKVRKKKGSG